MDDTAIKLNKMKIESGNFPKKENEIVLSQGILDELGMQAKIGDEITLPYQLYEKGGMGYEQQDTFRINGRCVLYTRHTGCVGSNYSDAADLYDIKEFQEA